MSSGSNGLPLPDGWERRRLSDCGTWLSGGTPKKSVSSYWNGDIPWAGPKDLHVRYVEDAEEHVTALGAQNGTRVVPADTILVVVRSMSLGNRLQIGLTRRSVAFNQDIKAIRPTSDVLPRFLLFALWGEHTALHSLVDEASHGTKRLRTELLAAFEIRLPPFREQERIALVLGALDDKAESNRRCASLLDAAWHASFRRHFASADEPLSGWTTGSAQDIATYVNGPAATKHANGLGRLIIRIKELNSGIGPSSVFTDKDFAAQNLADPDSILFAWSGSLGVHRWHRDEAVINQHIFKVVCDRGYPPWFVFGRLVELMPRFRAIAADKATTMGHIKRQHLAEATVALPPEAVLDQWDRRIGPLYDKVHTLERESLRLAQIRDALLPKLISGQIRVPDTTDPEEALGVVAEEAAA